MRVFQVTAALGESPLSCNVLLYLRHNTLKVLQACDNTNPNQAFHYDEESQSLVHVPSNTCLDAQQNSGGPNLARGPRVAATTGVRSVARHHNVHHTTMHQQYDHEATGDSWWEEIHNVGLSGARFETATTSV
jgi:hypothetical protein